jgi:hypothetical protein
MIDPELIRLLQSTSTWANMVNKAFEEDYNDPISRQKFTAYAKQYGKYLDELK